MSNTTNITCGRQKTGFTLVEMLLVISVILILMGMAVPAFILARNHSRKAGAMSMVVNVEAAFAVYLDEMHHLPPTEVDNSLATNHNMGGALRALDLLVPEGLSLNGNMLSDDTMGLPHKLVDEWDRPILFTADQVVGGAIVFNKPAPVGIFPTDWNPKAKVPFAYIWALGIPTKNGDAYDIDPTQNFANWLYVHDKP